MSDKIEINENNVPLTESFNGANKLSPQNPKSFEKSFNGALNVAPPAEDNGDSSNASSDSSPSEQTQSENSSSD